MRKTSEDSEDAEQSSVRGGNTQSNYFRGAKNQSIASKDAEIRASRVTVDSNARQTPNDFSIRSTNPRFKSKLND